MEECRLKPCPFCGGEVTIAESGDDLTKWMFVTRGNKENACKCRVFMESKPYYSDCEENDKKSIKRKLINEWNKRI